MAPSLADLFQEMLKDLEVEREELEKEKVEIQMIIQLRLYRRILSSIVITSSASSDVK